MTGRPIGGRSPKRRRLSRSAEFERVYRHGRSKSNRFLVLYAFPRGEEQRDVDTGARLGLSVSRRVGGAVERTRVKRVLREAFWAEAERLPEGSDYVVVARPDARELAEREGMPGVRVALGELVAALGGTPEPSSAARAVQEPHSAAVEERESAVPPSTSGSGGDPSELDARKPAESRHDEAAS